jgi:PAS domain S-box-containing protein
MTPPSGTQADPSHRMAGLVAVQPEQLFRVVFEQAAVGIALIETATGRFLRVNQRYCEIVGLSRDDMTVTTFMAITHPDDLQAYLHNMEELKASRIHNFSMEKRFFRSDGSIGWIDLTVSPLWEAGEQPSFHIAVVQDITERKRTEALLETDRYTLELIASGASLTDVLDRLCRMFEDMSPGLLSSVLLMDQNRLRHGAAPSLPPSYRAAIDGVHIGPSIGSCGTAAYLQQQVIVADIANDPLWADYREIALKHHLRACWSTPIFSEDRSVLGTFAMYYREPRSPSAYDLKISEHATKLAAIVIERAQAEEAIRESEVQLRLSLDASQAGIWSWDAVNSVSTWDECYHRLYGFGPHDPVAYETWIARVHPEDWPRLEARVRTLLEPGTGDSWHEEFRARHPVKGERWMEGRACVERDSNGRAIRFAGIDRDVTERKRAEEALRMSEERFALAMQGANDGIWDWNILTNEAYHSPRWKALLGLQDDNLPCRAESFFQRIHPDDVDYVTAAVHAHLEQRIPYDLELRLRHQNGSYRWFRSSGQALWDNTGRPVRMVGALTDITDKKKAFDALQKAYQRLQALSREVRMAEEKERRRFSRELHDEFGQLLSALKFDVSRIADDLGRKPALKPSVVRKELIVAASKVDQLFTSLREMVRGLRPAVLEELGLIPAIQALAMEAQERSRLRCRVAADQEDFRKSCGPELESTLFRIAQELLTNVVRHAKATTATVTIGSEQGWIVLTVQDNGRGFDIHAVGKKNRFGLRGVQERAELLGGTVTIDSTRKVGTTVTVRIPIEFPMSNDSQVAPDRKRTIRSAKKRSRRGN